MEIKEYARGIVERHEVATAAHEAPAVGIALARQTEGLERLEQTVDSLLERIRPVLGDDQDKIGLAVEIAKSDVPIATDIHTRAERIERIEARLRDALHRLGV